MSIGQSPLCEPALFEPLKDLVAKYGIVNLVETGTGPSSSGMEAAARLGLRGYSCDVFWPCVEDERARHPQFTIYHGGSADFFRIILPELEGPTFFWLDGHCPTDQACIPAGIFPIYEELTLIRELKRGYERDVVWLDDIAMVDVPDNPLAVHWDVSLAGVRWQGQTDRPFSEYLAVLGETHDWSVDRESCTLRLEPKP